MNTTMETIILLVGEFFSSLFLWIGIALLAERATISALQKRFIQIFGALLFLVWFAATPLLAQSGFFLGVGIPLTLLLTLLFGFVLMFSHTFRQLDYRHSSVSGARGNVAHWVCSRPAARSVCSSGRDW